MKTIIQEKLVEFLQEKFKDFYEVAITIFFDGLIVVFVSGVLALVKYCCEHWIFRNNQELMATRTFQSVEWISGGLIISIFLIYTLADIGQAVIRIYRRMRNGE